MVAAVVAVAVAAGMTVVVAQEAGGDLGMLYQFSTSSFCKKKERKGEKRWVAEQMEGGEKMEGGGKIEGGGQIEGGGIGGEDTGGEKN